MSQTPGEDQNRKQYWLNLTLAGAAGQVGCVTLVIVISAVLGGLWLDSLLDTRPLFTIILMIASIPVSLGVMLYLVRLLTKKIKAQLPPQNSAKGVSKDEPEAVLQETEREQQGG
jgi:F0F1-type ATP synthase assembly protein I